jgi:hypothetical protein
MPLKIKITYCALLVMASLLISNPSYSRGFNEWNGLLANTSIKVNKDLLQTDTLLLNKRFRKLNVMLGGGTTAAKRSGNYQATAKYFFHNYKAFHLGVLAGHANRTALWPESKRTTLMLLSVLDAVNFRRTVFYCNLGLGVSKFSNAQTIGLMGENLNPKKINYLYSFHFGLGVRYHWFNKVGLFAEMGLGAPYVFNAGLFF